MMSLKSFERTQEIQQQLVWQSVLELEPRAFIPEVSHRLHWSSRKTIKEVKIIYKTSFTRSKLYILERNLVVENMSSNFFVFDVNMLMGIRSLKNCKQTSFLIVNDPAKMALLDLVV